MSDAQSAPFIVDVARKLVHRRASARFMRCERTIDWTQAQGAEDMLKASMVLKTRHFNVCPECWPA